jgi:hypothetical protein
VAIDELEGRITTSLLTPYPPGIPLLIPGERFNRKIVDFLRFTREFNAAFPGFDTDVHGLVEDDGEGAARRYYVDCVATRLTPPPRRMPRLPAHRRVLTSALLGPPSLLAVSPCCSRLLHRRLRQAVRVWAPPMSAARAGLGLLVREAADGADARQHLGREARWGRARRFTVRLRRAMSGLKRRGGPRGEPSWAPR